MSYAYRIKSRLSDDGIIKTCKYLLAVSVYTLHNFILDSYMDLKYSRRLLKGNKKTPFKHLGSNDTYHTTYAVMPLIFKNVSIKPDDVLVDIGCGKGRVINYWLHKKHRNKIIGLELDPNIAALTASQFSRFKNVSIISGDAISNLPDEGTVFYFYNPFTEEKVREFERKISELSQKRPIKIIYYNPKSIHIFYNGNWAIDRINFEKDYGVRRWGRMNKFHDLAIVTRQYK